MLYKLELVNTKEDISKSINQSFISMRITDNKKDTSDTLELTLYNNNFKLKPPPLNTLIKVYLDGFVIGVFYLDEYKINLSANTLVINGKGADFKAILKQKSSCNFLDATFGDIIRYVARNTKMRSKINPAIDTMPCFGTVQNNESYLNLLNRLVYKYGAIFKINDDILVVTLKGESASKKQLHKVHLSADRDILGDSEFTISSRNTYKSAVCFYKDENMDRKKGIRAGVEAPTFFIKELEKTEKQAETVAKAKLEALRAGNYSANLKLNKLKPDIKAGGFVNLSGLNQQFNGDWLVEKAIHELSGSNIKTSLEINKIQ